MKILDRYIAKNFIIGYVISLLVLLGMRILIDLFVNLDEFAEQADLGAMGVFNNIVYYYGFQSALYFRDFAGMIIVVAAVFSLAKMTRNNELIAVMASGVSLKRVIMPIIILAVIFNGLFIIDKEFIIPRFATQLVRPHDALPGEQVYGASLLMDSNGHLLYTSRFNESEKRLREPTIITREREKGTTNWITHGMIRADSAVYDEKEKLWKLKNGRYYGIREEIDEFDLSREPTIVETYKSDITPEQIPIRRREAYQEMLSFQQLWQLEKNAGHIKDLAKLYSLIHFRFTEPIINMIMLLIALPILVVRDPKTMKSAIIVSFLLTMACFVFTMGCKMMATEVVFDKIRPEIWAWTPILVFLPVAMFELESMRT